ncbi:MAG TPA: hypothetical protein VF469_34860 [Kofleriaceae bacterium]
MRCWYTRWQLSSALDRGELSSCMARGHAARCASCQAFGDDLAALHARLSRDSHTAAPPRPAVRRVHMRWLVAGPLAAAAAAAIAITVPRHGPDAIVSSPAPAPVATSEVVARIQGLADGVSQLFARTPLESELDNLVDDGKRGLAAVLATGGL